MIVLSAHLDHLGARPSQPGVDTIFNGADDDASGTVAVMALAEALSQGPRPKRTIVFAAFGSEESGGAGAGFFVDLPVVPLNQIVADLQFEMLGRPDPKIPANHLWLTGYERSNLGAELAKQGAALVADPHPEQSFFTRSDNIRFARRGVIAHTVSSFNLHTDYHRASDEIRLIDFPYMTASIRSHARADPLAGEFDVQARVGGRRLPCALQVDVTCRFADRRQQRFWCRRRANNASPDDSRTSVAGSGTPGLVITAAWTPTASKSKPSAPDAPGRVVPTKRRYCAPAGRGVPFKSTSTVARPASAAVNATKYLARRTWSHRRSLTGRSPRSSPTAW